MFLFNRHVKADDLIRQQGIKSDFIKTKILMKKLFYWKNIYIYIF